jgi:hypothetical protein
MQQVAPEGISFNDFVWPSSLLSLDLYPRMVREERLMQPVISDPKE